MADFYCPQMYPRDKKSATGRVALFLSVGTELRGCRIPYFHVSGTEIDEEIFAHELVADVYRLPVSEIQLEPYRFSERVIYARSGVSAGEGIGGEIRTVDEKRY